MADVLDFPKRPMEKAELRRVLVAAFANAISAVLKTELNNIQRNELTVADISFYLGESASIMVAGAFLDEKNEIKMPRPALALDALIKDAQPHIVAGYQALGEELIAKFS